MAQQEIYQKTVDLHCQKMPLESVLHEIFHKTKINFVFNDQFIKDKQVTCDFESALFEEVLKNILSPYRLSYRWTSDNVIVLFNEAMTLSSIQGIVLDAESDRPLPYANVVLNGTEKGSASDSVGYFQIDRVGMPSCSLTVSYIGYNPEERMVFASNRSELIEIIMKQNPVLTESVTVTGDHIRSFNISETHSSKISFLPASQAAVPSLGASDCQRSLQLMPGISAIHEKISDLSIWGGERVHNMIYFDGIPVCYRPEVYFGMVSPFHPLAIEKVNVHKGAYGAQYGDCIGGIIELTGNNIHDNQFKMSAGADLFQINGFIQVPVSKRLKFFCTVSRSFDGIDKGPVYHDVYSVAKGSYISIYPGEEKITGYSGQNEQYAFLRTMGKLLFDISSHDQFCITYYAGKEKELYQAMNHTDNNKYQFKTIWKWHNIGSSLKYNHQWNAYSSSNIQFVYTNDFRPFDYFSNKNRLFETWDSEFDTTHIQYKMNTFRISAGNSIEWHPFKIDMGYEVNQRSPMFKEKTAYHIPYTNPLNDRVFYHFAQRYDKTMKNVFYMQSSCTPINKLNLGLGVRVVKFKTGVWELTDENQKQNKAYQQKNSIGPHFLPRVSMSYQLSEGLTLKCGWGQYYQYAAIQNDLANNKDNFYDLWWHADHKMLPNQSEHRVAELLFERKNYCYMIEVYQKKINRLTLHRNDAPLYFSSPLEKQYWEQDFLQGSGLTEGLNLSLQKTSGPLTGWLCYHYGTVMYQFQNVNNGTPFSPKNYRAHEIKAAAGFSFRAWRFTMTGVYGSPVRSFNKAVVCPENDTPPRNLDLPYYQQVCLNIRRTFNVSQTIHCDAGISLLNLLNYQKIVDREIFTNMESGYYEIQERRMLPLVPFVFLNVTYQ
ncbi:TonB-dependent receptor [bacterium]|nr:TonB-dependent receptor [bacterium]